MNRKNREAAFASLHFIGNRLATSVDLVGPDGKTLRQKYIIGAPAACPAGTAEEMGRRGYVGLYKRESFLVLRIPNSNLTLRVPGRRDVGCRASPD